MKAKRKMIKKSNRGKEGGKRGRIEKRRMKRREGEKME